MVEMFHVKHCRYLFEEKLFIVDFTVAFKGGPREVGWVSGRERDGRGRIRPGRGPYRERIRRLCPSRRRAGVSFFGAPPPLLVGMQPPPAVPGGSSKGYRLSAAAMILMDAVIFVD